jgi:mono/diheme cytochrome c family protein
VNLSHPLILGATVAGLGFCSATLLAHELQARARARSHEQPPWTALPAPAGSTPETLRAAGRKLFLDNCAHCHGADASGDEGPDLHELEVSDRRIATVVRGGIKGEMPSFAKKLHPEDIAALIAYLRTLE